MPVYRVSIIWGQAFDSASETWYSPNAADTVVANQLTQLLSLRAQFAYTNQYFGGVRVSQYGVKRSSILSVPPTGSLGPALKNFAIPANGVLAQRITASAPGQFRAALQNQIFFANGRSAIRYFAGVPNELIGTEPATLNVGKPPDYWNNKAAYVLYLINNSWSVRAQQLPPDGTQFSVIGVTTQAAPPSLLGIQIAAATAPAIAMGAKVALQHFRPAKNTRNNTINGTWYVASVDVTGLPLFVTVYLRNSAGIDPNSVRFTDTSLLRPVTYQLYPLLQTYPIRVGIHKRGRSPLAPRGRRLTRGSLDP